jgi:hypothetical protein
MIEKITGPFHRAIEWYSERTRPVQVALAGLLAAALPVTLTIGVAVGSFTLVLTPVVLTMLVAQAYRER